MNAISLSLQFKLEVKKRHPREMGAPEVEAFLSDLATQGRVTASTQNQALSASSFLCRKVLGIELIGRQGVNSAKSQTHIPGCSDGGVRSPLDRP